MKSTNVFVAVICRAPMSAPNRRLVVSPAARLVLSDVLLYSQQQWGRQQRRTYRATLAKAMQRLVEFPMLGRSAEVLPSVRSHLVGEDVILYVTDDLTVTVLRIVYRRMDIERAIEDCL